MITEKLFGREESIYMPVIQIGLLVSGGILGGFSLNSNTDIAKIYLSLFLRLGVVGIVFLIPGVYLMLRVEKELIKCTALLCIPRILNGQGVTWDTLASLYKSVSRPLIGDTPSLATTEAQIVLELVKEYCAEISPMENEGIEILLSDARRSLPPRVGGSSVPNLLMFGLMLLGGTFLTIYTVSRWGTIDQDSGVKPVTLIFTPVMIFGSSLFFISVTIDGIRALMVLSRTLPKLKMEVGLK